VARQTRSQRRARREAREASAAAASAPPRRRVSQSVAPAGDGGTSVEAAPKEREHGNRLFRFIGESYAELKKVDWPNQTQVITGTTVVLIACLIVGFYLYVNDEVWKRVVQHIFL